MKPFDEAGLYERAAYEAGGAQRQTLKKLNVIQSDCRRFLPGENTPDTRLDAARANNRSRSGRSTGKEEGRDVHHAEAALHLALLALQLDASSLGGRSCGEEEDDDDGCPRSCRRRPGGPTGAPGRRTAGETTGTGRPPRRARRRTAARSRRRGRGTSRPRTSRPSSRPTACRASGASTRPWQGLGRPRRGPPGPSSTPTTRMQGLRRIPRKRALRAPTAQQPLTAAGAHRRRSLEAMRVMTSNSGRSSRRTRRV